MAVTHETSPLRNFLLIWVQSQRNFAFNNLVYSPLRFTTLSIIATQNISLPTSVTQIMFEFSFNYIRLLWYFIRLQNRNTFLYATENLFFLLQTCFTLEGTWNVPVFHRCSFCYSICCPEQYYGATMKFSNESFLCLGRRQRYFTKTEPGRFVLLSACYLQAK